MTNSRGLITAAILLFIQSAEAAPLPPPLPSPNLNEERIIGKWKVVDGNVPPNGPDFSLTVEFTRDGKFNMDIAIDKTHSTKSSGKYRLKGDRLFYDHNEPEEKPKHLKDQGVQIESISGDTMILSGRSGNTVQRNTFKRIP